MKDYVLDASVVVTFLLGKSPSVERKFRKLLKQVRAGKAKLHSSYLLPLEVGNGLRYSPLDQASADEVFQRFSNLPIEHSVFSFPQLLQILQLSYRFGTSVYDTSYHFLAKLVGGTFITRDKEYFKKAKDFGNIELL